MLSDSVISSLVRDCGCDTSKSLVVGVSGGPDSLALLHCLREAGLKIIVAHLDHQLRPSSAEEAQAIKGLAKAWGLRCVVGQSDVRAYAAENHMGLEEAARFLRYRFLLELAARRRAQAVVVAHTADDQVETILMHFLRGAGLKGLGGMRPVSRLAQIQPDIPIFRPMLEVSRQEVLEYCQAHNLAYIEDASNADTTLFRNRLRHELIPLLEGYNPAIKKIIRRSSQALRADSAILEDVEDDAFERCLVDQRPTSLTIDRAAFLGLPIGLRMRIVLRTVFTLNPALRDFGFENVQNVLEAIELGKPQVQLSAGLQLSVGDGRIRFYYAERETVSQAFPQLVSPEPAALAAGQSLALQNGWQISADMLARKSYLNLPADVLRDPKHGFINPADLEWPLEVRPKREGESWKPLGMGLNHQKLGDFFTNNKIPRPARALWPLVTSGGSLIWVAGLRIAQPWRLLGDEWQILHLQLIAPADEITQSKALVSK